MRIIDSHFHWWPRSVLNAMCKRTEFPYSQPNDKGGYTSRLLPDIDCVLNGGAEWYDIEAQFAHMDALGHDVSVVGSIGPFSVFFSTLPVEEGRDLAILWNEEMSAQQARYPTRFYGTAAIPLQDEKVAMDVLEDAVNRLGLVGVNLPGSVGVDSRIDAERLQSFYARCAELNLPVYLHPTDAVFNNMLNGYGGALHSSLGRVVEVSSAAMRLVLSGTLERHPDLKLVMSHTGGALPYQSGRMDKNTKGANLPKPASHYLKRMYTDTVTPHSAGMRFAINYYGIDNVMYGTDYPCWLPSECLAYIAELNVSAEDSQKLFFDNAVRILNLPSEVGSWSVRAQAAE
ncbi:MAG: amidohydrolase family protein [Beijerinckiaceae bacterium]|nr:amidohydrolase family protein [Beijerinckiaceae bacterium]